MVSILLLAQSLHCSCIHFICIILHYYLIIYHLIIYLIFTLIFISDPNRPSASVSSVLALPHWQSSLSAIAILFIFSHRSTLLHSALSYLHRSNSLILSLGIIIICHSLAFWLSNWHHSLSYWIIILALSSSFGIISLYSQFLIQASVWQSYHSGTIIHHSIILYLSTLILCILTHSLALHSNPAFIYYLISLRII